jgi:hypothetical protein
MWNLLENVQGFYKAVGWSCIKIKQYVCSLLTIRRFRRAFQRYLTSYPDIDIKCSEQYDLYSSRAKDEKPEGGFYMDKPKNSNEQ